MDHAAVARSFIEVLADHLAARTAEDPLLAPFATELARVDTSVIQRGPQPRPAHPTLALLEPALATADGDTRLVQAASAAARHLDWGQIYQEGALDPALVDGMFAAQAAGTYGRFRGESVAAGLFFIAPGVHYPLHTHAAEEIYYCVSGTIDIQHGIGRPAFAVAAGDYSITPSGRVHALTTRDAPVLMVYVWIGDIHVPIWIWQQLADGAWSRERWQRRPGEPWKVAEREPVSEAAMAEAHV